MFSEKFIFLSFSVFSQLIKFIPQSDEVELLTSHKDELEKFARADMFLYEMSCIPHYGQRLETLFFKKKLTERVGEVQPKLQGKIGNLQNITVLLCVLCFLTLGLEISGHQVRSRFMLCVNVVIKLGQGPCCVETQSIALYFLRGKLSSGVKFNGVVIFFSFSRHRLLQTTDVQHKTEESVGARVGVWQLHEQRSSRQCLR